ncbi:hypothetical protein [Streptomyces sp. NPDC048269]
MALTTTHPGVARDADVVAGDLPALSALVGADGPTSGTEGRTGPSQSGM